MIHMNVTKHLQPEKDMIQTCLLHLAPISIKWEKESSLQVAYVVINIIINTIMIVSFMAWGWIESFEKFVVHKFSVSYGKFYLHRTFPCLRSATQK